MSGTSTRNHPAVALVRRSFELVPDHPALMPVRAQLALVAASPSGREELLRRVVRSLRRAGLHRAADHAGHALLLLAAIPVAPDETRCA